MSDLTAPAPTGLGYQYKAREARDHFKLVLDAAERGDIAVVRREAPMVVVRRDIYDATLEATAPFDVKSSIQSGQVSFWIDGMPVHGVGASLEEAENDFLDAIVDYAGLWIDELRHAPNHKQNASLVRRITMYAGDREELRRIVFGDE